MNFNDFFSTSYCATRANSIIADNRQAIIDSGFGTAQEYMTDNIVNFDYEIYNWLKAEAVEAYDAMDSAHQAVVTDMLFDWLEANYNYAPETGWSYDEDGEQFDFSNGKSLERWQIVLLRDRQTPDEMREHLLANLPEEWDANMVDELYDFVSKNP